MFNKFIFLNDSLTITMSYVGVGLSPVYKKMKSYHSNGKTFIEYRYENNDLHGTVNVYYDNGMLMAVKKYNHGKRIGVWEYYDMNSKLIRKEKYKNDELIYTELEKY